MSMSDCETVDDILTEFAKRDPAGYIVWGQKILVAHNRECEQLNTEIEAMSKFNDALNAQMKELAAECERLRSLVKEMADKLASMSERGLRCDKCEFDCDNGCVMYAVDALVAKAREEVKKCK